MSQLGGSENGPSGDIMGLTTLCKLKAIEHAAGCRQRMHKTHTQLTHTHTYIYIYVHNDFNSFVIQIVWYEKCQVLCCSLT
jgi:hypothetical protein